MGAEGSAVRTTLRYALLIVCAAVVLFPVYVAVVLAIQPGDRFVAFPSSLLPTELQLENFRQAFDQANLSRYLLNSALVTAAIVAGQVLTSILAAYVFAFVELPGKRFVFLAFLATLMVPVEATIVGNYDTIVDLGWLDSYQALIVPFLATAFGTFLIRQAFLGLPRDLREAAALDGYGHLGFLRHVAVPLAKPSIAAFSVFSFLMAWNQYLWPLLVTNSADHRTVQIGLKALAASRLEEFSVALAGTVLAALPIFVLLVLFQRQLVRGLTSGAVKG